MYKTVRPFLTLLALYLVLIVIFDKPLRGDEFRYIRYAENMVHGFYTDSANPDLSNGPGYPLIIYPFVALDLPFLTAKLLNGLFVFMGVVFIYMTLRLYIKKKYSLVFAFILGLYPPLFRWMPLIYSESLSFLLMSGFIYYFCCLFKFEKNKWKNSILTSFFIGFLILTKVVFFHVVILSAILASFLFFSKHREASRKVILVIVGGILLNAPFIIYAYSITGKLFYLGTRGGEILYHRSTPYENEWGNWFSDDRILNPEMHNSDSEGLYSDLSELSKNHRDFYLQINTLPNIEKDSAFKAKAIDNMKSHPVKYLKNTISNVGRLFFNYPISYRSQNLNAYGYILPNMFILVLFALILYPAFLQRKIIPFEIKTVFIISLIYLCGMILLGGKGRYLIVVIPSFFLFLGYCYTNLIKISFREPKKKEVDG